MDNRKPCRERSSNTKEILKSLKIDTSDVVFLSCREAKPNPWLLTVGFFILAYATFWLAVKK